jgi:hypothetical protein
MVYSCTEFSSVPSSRKRVRIDLDQNSVQVFETPDNTPPSYLSEEDYRRRRLEDHRIIAKLEASMSLLLSPLCNSSKRRRLEETDDFSGRGLEGRTQLEKLRRRQSRHDTLIAVLEEQWYQNVEGHSNPELIAQVYRSYSSSALEEAQRRAKEDAEFVQKWRSQEMENHGIETTSAIILGMESPKTMHPRPPENMSVVKKRKTLGFKPFVATMLKQLPREPLVA